MAGARRSDLGAAFARLHDAIRAIQRQQEQWAELVASIEPLETDPRCRGDAAKLPGQ